MDWTSLSKAIQVAVDRFKAQARRFSGATRATARMDSGTESMVGVAQVDEVSYATADMSSHQGFTFDVMIGYMEEPAPVQNERMIPALYDQTGTTDLSVELQNFINTTPNNYTIKFQPDAIYRADTILFLSQRRDLTVDYNGGTLKQVDIAPFGDETTVAAASNGATVQATTLTVANAAVFDAAGTVLVVGTRGAGTVTQLSYTGKSGNVLTGVRNKYPRGTGTTPDPDMDTGVFATGQRVVQPIEKSLRRVPSDPVSDSANGQWSLSRCTNIRFTSSNGQGVSRGPSVQGGVSGVAYIPALEFCHNFRIHACQGVEIDHLDFGYVFGDFVYMQWINTEYSTDISVHDCNIERNGRVAISPMAVDGFEFYNNTMTRVRRSFFDIEPPSNNCRSQNLWIHDNEFGSKRLLWLAASGGVGQNVPVDNILIEDNTSASHMTVEFRDPNGGRRGPLIIRDNVSTANGYGSPNGHCIRVWRVDELTVTGNTIPLQVRTPAMYLVRAEDCTDVTVSGNILTPVSNSNQVHEF